MRGMELQQWDAAHGPQAITHGILQGWWVCRTHQRHLAWLLPPWFQWAAAGVELSQECRRFLEEAAEPAR